MKNALSFICLLAAERKPRWKGTSDSSQPLKRIRLCGFGWDTSASRRSRDDSHRDPEPRDDVDEGIGAEAPQSSAPEIVDAPPAHPKRVASPGLVRRRALTTLSISISRSARLSSSVASAGGNPRSRNTLPVDRVTLIFRMSLDELRADNAQLPSVGAGVLVFLDRRHVLRPCGVHYDRFRREGRNSIRVADGRPRPCASPRS